ncbi:DHHA1 domain-containing protein [Occallatibacter riparius]|uniref:Alanine--tRNA ligase n=1 Tax=Occallatibacter riparius TaxID=1002689 RepID=A0A9J7BSC8_9BACT|nr:DHHA1 domain-containing protein [Occallatibacter riparius]
MQQTERLYYSDSFLKTFAAEVTGVRELAGNTGDTVWQISLNHSAFYPTSGGQPFDTGVLRTPDGAETPIEEVEEDEQGAVWHFARTPLAAGAHVEGQIDWQRRFDHMQQHTGQHLLSAVFARELKAGTVSFHLGEKISTIDLTCANLPEHSLERVEQIANEIIAEDRPVTTKYVSAEEAQALLAAGDLRKLPERAGSIRLVDIADCDLNACGGTHVRSTGQIGGLQIRGVEKVSRGVRVEFLCGFRAIRAARANAAILDETGALLSTGAPELPATVARLLAEGKAGAKERQKLREELAVFHAEKLVAEAPLAGGIRVIVREFKDRDRDSVRLLASRTAAAAVSTAVILCANDADPVRVFLARSRDLNFDCGRMLREALAQLGLRGGGSPDMAQGDVPRAMSSTFLDSLSASVRNAAVDKSK